MLITHRTLTVMICVMDHGCMTLPPRITSRQNPRVKEAVRLRTGRARQRQGRFVIDGAREISRAAAAGVPFVEAFICEELCDSPDSRNAVDAVRSTGAEVFSVTPDVYDKLGFGERKEGVVVVAEVPQRRLHDLKPPANPLVAVLEGIEKPGNLGAIMRSADAVGIDAVIVADGGTDLYNPNTIRASLGTVFRKNVCEATSVETNDWLRDRGLSIFAARRSQLFAALGLFVLGLLLEFAQAQLTTTRLGDPRDAVANTLGILAGLALSFTPAASFLQRLDRRLFR